jgi:hypothetical protein
MTTFILRAEFDHAPNTTPRTVNFHYHPADPNDMVSHLDHFREFLRAAGVPGPHIDRLFLNPPDDLK